MTTTETTIAAKVTDCQLEEPVQPPNFWTVEVDGRELYVMTEYDEGELRLTSVQDAESDELLLAPYGHDAMSDELRAAIHAALMAEIEGFNLPLLAGIVRALIRDTLQARDWGHGGILDNFPEIPVNERIERDRDRPAPALEEHARATVKRLVDERLASGELQRTRSGGLIEASRDEQTGEDAGTGT